MKPMMSEQEIIIIESLLEQAKPKVCLEWGSGGSTVYFPNKYPFIEKWVSIEHDSRYYELIRHNVAKSVELIKVPLQGYLSAVEDRKFDFILIDGLMRAECLLFAWSLLNPGGMVLLHDAGRHEYLKAIKTWEGGKQKLSEGEIEMTTFAHRGLYKFTK